MRQFFFLSAVSMKTLRCVDSSHSPERHSLFLNVIFQHREQGDCLRWREGTNLAYFYFLDNFGEYPSSFFLLPLKFLSRLLALISRSKVHLSWAKL